MRYKNLGKSGIQVSAMGLGCGNFGGLGSLASAFGKGDSVEEAFTIMERALEMGINFFDTANSYGGGRSEAYIGKWLKEKGSHGREQVLIATKVFYPVGEGPDERGLSRKHIFQQVEASLQRMGLDYIDLYLSHEPDPETPLEETLLAFHDLVVQGKIRCFGACNISASLIQDSLRISQENQLSRYEWIQNEYNLLQVNDEKEIFPLCKKEGLGCTPFSPLAGGWLSGKYRKGERYPAGSRMTVRPDPYKALEQDSIHDSIESLKQFAREKDTDLPSLSLAWVMSHPQVTSPIVGLRKKEHFEQVKNALKINLSAEERNQISSFIRKERETREK